MYVSNQKSTSIAKVCDDVICECKKCLSLLFAICSLSGDFDRFLIDILSSHSRLFSRPTKRRTLHVIYFCNNVLKMNELRHSLSNLRFIEKLLTDNRNRFKLPFFSLFSTHRNNTKLQFIRFQMKNKWNNDDVERNSSSTSTKQSLKSCQLNWLLKVSMNMERVKFEVLTINKHRRTSLRCVFYYLKARIGSHIG